MDEFWTPRIFGVKLRVGISHIRGTACGQDVIGRSRNEPLARFYEGKGDVPGRVGELTRWI